MQSHADISLIDVSRSAVDVDTLCYRPLDCGPSQEVMTLALLSPTLPTCARLTRLNMTEGCVSSIIHAGVA